MTLTLLTALAVILLRVGLFYNGYPPEGTDFMIVHFLAIVTLVFFTGYRLLSIPETSFPELVRQGLRNASVYALLIGVFLWIFYTYIDTAEFPRKIAERVVILQKEGMEETAAREKLQAMFNPFNYASITFFALLAIGAFNAILIGGLQHKLLRRFRQ